MTEQERPDLGAMVMRLGRRLIAMEEPILRYHRVTMWGYIVLTALRDGPMPTQAALAARIGADKTRFISVLDDLQRQGYINRVPDSMDRRARLVELTQEGRIKQGDVQRDIRTEEGKLMAHLAEGDREAFLRGLQGLGQTAGG